MLTRHELLPSAARIRARCEMDLSPGAAAVPEKWRARTMRAVVAMPARVPLLPRSP